jgi:hypothetical protein
VTEFLRQSGVHVFRDQVLLAICKPEDLFDQIRTREKETLIRHEKDGLDIFVKMSVHLSHLKLVFEI